jgi:hypothetical protein
MARIQILFPVLILIAILSGCEKETKFVPNNTAPDYSAIPTIKIENYINRLFIDLIGREPIQQEMNQFTSFLMDNKLSFESRTELVNLLQTNTDFIAHDSSYQKASNKRLYELLKARFIEGASNTEINEFIGNALQDYINDSLNGNWGAAEISKARVTNLKLILQIPNLLLPDTADFRKIYKILLINDIYDFINMNSFNFVRSCFNDLFNRFPTQSEFNVGYNMVENNISGILFGQVGTTKTDFTDILVQSNENFEGTIRWLYRTYMARDAQTYEVQKLMTQFIVNKDIKWLQSQILITDEYAGFN